MSKQTVNVSGKEIDWTVSGAGVFKAEIAGEQYEADSLKKLTAMLRDAAKKTPLTIPFVEVSQSYRNEDLEIRRGVVTGRHSGNRNLLGRYADNGECGQLKIYSRNRLAGDVDVDKLKALYAAKQVACKAYDKFLEENALEVPL